MTTEAQFKFHGRDEVLQIFDTGGDLVGFLGAQTAECPLIGSEIQLVEKLGKGEFGAVFLLKIKGMGSKEYVAKKMDLTVYEFEPQQEGLTITTTLEKFAEMIQKKYNISAKIFIFLNGAPTDIVGPNTLIYWPNFAHRCLTKTDKTYRRFAGNGNTVVPAGSYLCDDVQYSEYVIGVLCGNLYRKTISINFLDVFGFATCFRVTKPYGMEASQYVFMERIDRSSRALRPCIFEKMDKFPEKFQKVIPNVLLIQILHAIATYQNVYQLQHNDLHDDNIFIEFIRPETTFNGQNLSEADWFHYRINKVDLYLPWVPLIAKIGDFGLSVKYSERLIGDRAIFRNGYDQHDGNGPWIPNWYSLCYDMLFITRTFYENNKDNIFIRSLLAKMIGLWTKVPSIPVIDFVINVIYKIGEGTRPTMSDTSRFDSKTSPAKILTDKSLLGEFMKRPQEGKIVTLGTI